KVEEPHDVLLSLFHGNIVCLSNIAGDTKGQLFRLGLIAIFLGCDAPIHVIRPLALLHWHEHGHIGIFVLGGKIDSLEASSTGEPDRRRLLNGTWPDVDVAIVVVFSLKSEGTRPRPRLDNQVMRLLHALTAKGRVDVVAKVFHASSAYKA